LVDWVLVGMFTIQMPEPYSAIFGTFGLIGLVVGMFKFAEWYDKQKQKR